MIDRFLMRSGVQLASGSESICQIWLRWYWIRGRKKKKKRRQYTGKKTETLRAGGREITGSTAGQEQGVAWEKNIVILWSVFQNAQAITQPVRATSLCARPSPRSSSAMISAATTLIFFGPFNSWPFADLCWPLLRGSNAEKRTMRRTWKEVSIAQKPRLQT